jgi:glutathione S-transferase
MTVETVSALRIARTIKADRQAVWNAWTQPEQMKHWACPAPGGLADATADLRVGGAFTMHMIEGGNEHNAFGVYREVDEPRRLVYTWDWREEDNQMGETLVTVEFNEVDVGTEVVLVHEGFPTAEVKDAHDQGWTACADHLEAYLS